MSPTACIRYGARGSTGATERSTLCDVEDYLGVDGAGTLNKETS